MSDGWLTVPETAERLGVTPQTVQRWLRAKRLTGRLLARKIGWRVDPASVKALLMGDAEHALLLELEKEQDNRKEQRQFDEEEAEARFKSIAKDIARDASDEAAREAVYEARANKVYGAARDSMIEKAMKDGYDRAYQDAWDNDFPVYRDQYVESEMSRLLRVEEESAAR